jgi:hypothetical protein
MTELMERLKQQLMTFPPAGKEVADLTDAERVALCIASGCKMDYRTENTAEGGYRMVASTVNLVGIVKIDGKFVVYERANEPGATITLPKPQRE